MDDETAVALIWAFIACKALLGGQTAHISEGDAVCRSSELGTLKDGQYGSWSCGHPNERRARFGHAPCNRNDGRKPRPS